MKSIYIGSVMTVAAVLLSGCGGGSDDGTKHTSSSAQTNDIPTKDNLAGSYGTTVKMNGYNVYTEIIVDPKGNYLGMASNSLSSNQPDRVFTILKGNINNLPLREFDIENNAINNYAATTRRVDRNNIEFNYLRVPSRLTRPKSLTVARVPSTSTSVSMLVGNFTTLSVSLQGAQASRTVIRNTRDANTLDMTVGYTDGCKLSGKITKKPNHTSWFDVTGRFSGSNCRIANQTYQGVISYDPQSRGPVSFGTNNTDSNAFVLVTKS